MSKPERLMNVADYEKASLPNLDTYAYDYYQSGALDEYTLKDNSAAFQHIKLIPRVMVSHVNTNTDLLGPFGAAH